jgi:hypothetical protein
MPHPDNKQETTMMFHQYKKAIQLTFTLFIGLLTHANVAVGSEAKQTPPSGVLGKMTSYTDRSYGFTIDLLKDFQLSSEQGDLLYFRSPDRAGTVIVRPRPGLSVSTVQATLRNGFDNDVIVLTPTGAPTTLELAGARGIAMEVEGTIEGREVYGIVAGIFGANNQGYMILAGIVREQWPGFEHLAKNMLQSFTVQPMQPGFAHERWQSRLNGRRLIYAEGYGTHFRGGVSIGEYHFCSDGTFRQRSDSMHTERYGWSRYSTGSTDKSRGTWQVRIQENKPLVQMRHKGGAVDFLNITEGDGYVLLSGVPYRFAVNELCK